jgi:tetratricopeptide (TPR) repeat protein
MRALLVLALTMAIGCAEAPLRPFLRCPTVGGAEWREYTSQHFVVSSDLSIDDARSMVGELEQTYRAFVDIAGWHFPNRGEPPGRMRLVVFASQSGYAAIGPRDSDGVFRPDTVDGEPLILIAADARGHSWHELVLHELTHRLLHFYVGNVPLWLDEGLAEYYSTFTLEGGYAYVGRVPLRVRGARLMLWLKPLLRAKSVADWSSTDGNAFYAGAWQLIYVLAQGYANELDQFLRRLAAGEAIDDAFAATIGPHTFGIEQSYNRQMHEGILTMIERRTEYRAPPRGTVDGERRLDESEVHLLWAAGSSPADDVFVAQIALAEQHAGVSPRSHFLRGVSYLVHNQWAEAEREFNAAVALDPSGERYRWVLARLHFDHAVEHHRPLDALEPDMHWLAEHGHQRDSLILVASFQSERGQLVEARASVERALAIDQASPFAWDALSVIGLKQGDIDGAIDAGERALRLAPHGVLLRATMVRLLKLEELRQKRDARIKGATNPPSP